MIENANIFLEVTRPLAHEVYTKAEQHRLLCNLNAMFSCMKIAAQKGGVMLAFSPTNFNNLFVVLVEIGMPDNQPPKFVLWRYNNESPGFFSGDYFLPDSEADVESKRVESLKAFAQFITDRMAGVKAAMEG